MPPGWNAIRALLQAAAFTPAELEVLCQSVFGTALSGITTATDNAEQAEAIVNFAIRYDMLRELTDLVLHESARRPAVQNLLLSDGMNGDNGAGQTQRIDDHERRLVRVEDRVEANTVDIREIKGALMHWQATFQRSTSAPINWTLVLFSVLLATLIAAGLVALGWVVR